MTLPKYTIIEEVNKIPIFIVNELRDKFLKEIADKHNDYYEQDIDRIKSSNWQLQRFLVPKKNNVEEALKSLIEAMKWRKAFGVLDIKASDFPQEIYKSGWMSIYGKDLDGSPVCIVRAKVNKKSKTWIELFKRYFIYNMEKLDNINELTGVTTLADASGSGLKNADLDYTRFALKVTRDYYPGLGKASLLYKLPSVLEPVFKTVISWLDDEEKKRIVITNSKTLNEYIAKDQLPDFLDGTNTQSYSEAPIDAPSIKQLADKLGLKNEKSEKLAKHFAAFIKE